MGLFDFVGDILGFGGGETITTPTNQISGATAEEQYLLSLLMEMHDYEGPPALGMHDHGGGGSTKDQKWMNDLQFQSSDASGLTNQEQAELDSLLDEANSGDTWLSPEKDKRLTELQQKAETASQQLAESTESTEPIEPGKLKQAMDDFLVELEKIKEMYSEFPDLVRDTIDPLISAYKEEIAQIQDAYTSQIEEISQMPGTSVSFGGQPLTTIKPLKTMGTLADLASQQWGSGMETAGKKFGSEYSGALEYLKQEEALPGRLGELANTELQSILGPLMQMWQTMHAGRMGSPLTFKSEYHPSFGEVLLPILGDVAASAATGKI